MLKGREKDRRAGSCVDFPLNDFTNKLFEFREFLEVELKRKVLLRKTHKHMGKNVHFLIPHTI